MTLTPQALRLPPGKRYDLIMAYGLKKDLVLAAPLDEASGSRRDHSGLGNNLTDNNTVTGNPGPSVHIPLASQFTALNSEVLTLDDNANVSIGNIDFSMIAWVYKDSSPANDMQIMAKNNDLAGNVRKEYILFWQNINNRFSFAAGLGTTWGTLVFANSFGAPSNSVWHMVYGERRSSPNQTGISVNGGTLDTQAQTITPVDTTAELYIGCYRSNAVNLNFWDGRICGVFMWKRLLTSQERTWLYNRGGGRSLSQLMLAA